MGREVRRVPPNWKHPNNSKGHPQPMYDRNFEEVFAKWLSDFDRIRAGNLQDLEAKCYGQPGMNPLAAWLNDEGQAPDPAYHRPWRDEDATWFQVWETVTEGTPVTPPFATKDELVNHLVERGTDFGGRWDRSRAEQFVADGWAPAFIGTIRK